MTLNKYTVVNFNEIEKGMIEEVVEFLHDTSYAFKEESLEEATAIVEKAMEALEDVLELQNNSYEIEVAV